MKFCRQCRGPLSSASERRSGRIWQENVWGNALHRVVTEGVSPVPTVDEAIVRSEQILSE
ncbi:MAG: hypothetical protein ACREJ5_15095 [Geminicoccaceae bacterium]